MTLSCRHAWPLALALVSACGQQLVQFDADAPGAIDLANAASDQSAAVDLARATDLSTGDDLRVGGDLAAPRDLGFPPSPLAACAAMLASAQTFALLGGQSVSNTGATAIVGGNLGVSPGNALVGIPQGMPIGGSIHVADAVAAQAQRDLTNTYNCTQAAVCDAVLTGVDLGGLTLKPGVYCFGSSAAQLQGSTLILDAQGNPQAIWVFQVMSTLTMLDNARVHVINGGSDCNVFWQIGSSATLGKGSHLVGTLLTLTSVTLNTGASVSGRVLTRNGAVTLDTNDIAVPGCSPAPPPPADGGLPGDGGAFDAAPRG